MVEMKQFVYMAIEITALLAVLTAAAAAPARHKTIVHMCTHGKY